MKILILFIFLLLFASSKKRDIIGHYHDNFGGELEINADSTFLWTNNLGSSNSFSVGKWRTKKDTIFFTIIPVYDTLRISGKKDQVFLSGSDHPSVVSEGSGAMIYALAGGQNRRKMPERLIIRGKKIFLINEKGRPDKQKEGPVHTWYEKNKGD